MASSAPPAQKKVERLALIKKFVDLLSEERELREKSEKTARKKKDMLTRHPFLGQIVGLARKTEEEEPAKKKRKLDIAGLQLSTPAAKQRMSQEQELAKLLSSLRTRVQQKKVIHSTTVSQILGLSKKLGLEAPQEIQQATMANLVLDLETGTSIDTVMRDTD